jgi:hypothetical protein
MLGRQFNCRPNIEKSKYFKSGILIPSTDNSLRPWKYFRYFTLLITKTNNLIDDQVAIIQAVVMDFDVSPPVSRRNQYCPDFSMALTIS